MIRLFILMFLIVPMVSQATTIFVKSDPENAEVFVRELGKNELIKVGNTPFTSSFLQITSQYIKKENFIIEVHAKNYLPFRMFVNDLGKTTIDIFANLQPKENFLKFRDMDFAIGKLFEAQRLMRSKQYDDALKLLTEIEKSQPHLSVISELIGSGHYIKKDFEAALDSYNKAYQINPDNKEAFKMKKYLERALRVQNSREGR